jgi:molybdopterin molybdotransferase
MDGYAVRISELSGGSLAVTGEIAIGKAPPAMPVGAALTIVTGAPVPEGCDAVIKREDVTESPGRIGFGAGVVASVKDGQNIRRRGENLDAGALVCGGGRLVTPALAGSLATFGMANPEVFTKVRVGVVITGDEVVDPGETPDEWSLRDSHGSVLGSMLSSSAWIERGPMTRAKDDAESIYVAAKEALDSCDALILTGGVSMGDHDHVPDVVRRMGAEVVFHRLPQRPGKPALGAVRGDGKPVFGLPGNPLSVLVTARRLVMPALARRTGMPGLMAPTLVRVTNGDAKTLGMWWHRLVRVTGDGEAELVVSRGSGDVPSAAVSDGFVEVPPGGSGDGPWLFYGWGW